MKLIEGFLIAEGLWNQSPEASTRLQSEWDKRKKKITSQREHQYFASIEQWLSFYTRNKEIVELGLEIGTPLYELIKKSRLSI